MYRVLVILFTSQNTESDQIKTLINGNILSLIKLNNEPLARMSTLAGT